MSRVRVIIEGESYMTLEGVAECYQCELGWLREVYEFGLLGDGRRVDRSIAIELAMLDRVADVLRMTVYQGIDLAVVAVIFDLD